MGMDNSLQNHWIRSRYSELYLQIQHTFSHLTIQKSLHSRTMFQKLLHNHWLQSHMFPPAKDPGQSQRYPKGQGTSQISAPLPKFTDKKLIRCNCQTWKIMIQLSMQIIRHETITEKTIEIWTLYSMFHWNQLPVFGTKALGQDDEAFFFKRRVRCIPWQKAEWIWKLKTVSSQSTLALPFAKLLLCSATLTLL